MSWDTTKERVLVVDDHTIIRRGLKNLIASRIPRVLVDEAQSLAAMRNALHGTRKPTLLILDLQLNDGNAMDVLQDLRERHPEIRILVYSMNSERIYAPRILTMGCAGYLSKNAPEEEVIQAIECVLRGGRYIGLETELRLLDEGSDGRPAVPGDPFERLSGRELRVLDEILSGAGVKEIAGRMDLGISTVATYKARLFEKLGVSNLMELQSTVRIHGYRRS